jgi:WSC domain-containing protein/List-Bact-rpt repeat protein
MASLNCLADIPTGDVVSMKATSSPAFQNPPTSNFCSTSRRKFQALLFLLIAFLIASIVPARAQVNVTMRHNDHGQTGANTSESILTVQNVAGGSFGRLFNLPIQGDLYAQVLVVSGLNIGGKIRNVAYIATGHNMVYAYDADDGTQLWNPAVFLGTPVPESVEGTHDIPTEVGVVGTPAIDTNTNTMFVVAKTYESGTQILKLHALSLITGGEQPNSPVQLSGSYPGTGDASSGGTVYFDSPHHNQRPGLTLANGYVYLAFASHGDQTPYHGWVLAYNASTLQLSAVFNTSPNSGGAGIWMSGQAPVVDAYGNLYVLTGNLITAQPSSNCPNQNTHAGDENIANTYGESYIKLSAGLTLLDYFKPYNAHQLDCDDNDISSGGAVEVPGSGYIVGGGKDGNFYVVSENGMGGFNSTFNNVAQVFPAATNPIFSSPVWWNNSIYFWGSSTVLKSWMWTGAGFNTNPLTQPGNIMSYSGYSANAELAVSANGAQSGTGVIWALLPQGNPNDYPNGGLPGSLYAFDASNLNVLYRNDYGSYSKYDVPTIANGKVYVPTNSSVVAVYGLATPSGYLGCYTDDTTRALPNLLGSSNETVESCKQKASNAGYAYAGLQWYGQCWAGNNLGYTRVPDGQCNTLCTANQNEVCGGAWHNSIYSAAQPVTLTVSVSGSGTVTSSPAGINCSGYCSANFNSGTVVTLTATPGSGYVFSGWSGGGCSGTGSCSISLTQATTVYASFTQSTQTLTVSVSPYYSGTIGSSPGGIWCNSYCSANFTTGTVVTLTAYPASGYTFAGWSGGGCYGTGTCNVSMTGGQYVTASFSSGMPVVNSVTDSSNGSPTLYPTSTIVVYGSNFSPGGGNTLQFHSYSGYGDVWMYQGDGHYYWDYSANYIYASIDSRLSPGWWILTVRNASGAASSGTWVYINSPPPVISAITDSSYSYTIYSWSTIIVWGSNFTSYGGNTLQFQSYSGYADVWAYEGDGHYYWDYSTGQINCSLDYRLLPGYWLVTVRNANGVASSPYWIYVN